LVERRDFDDGAAPQGNLDLELTPEVANIPDLREFPEWISGEVNTVNFNWGVRQEARFRSSLIIGHTHRSIFFFWQLASCVSFTCKSPEQRKEAPR
jgi:hypothetical protein